MKMLMLCVAAPSLAVFGISFLYGGLFYLNKGAEPPDWLMWPMVIGVVGFAGSIFIAGTILFFTALAQL